MFGGAGKGPGSAAPVASRGGWGTGLLLVQKSGLGIPGGGSAVWHLPSVQGLILQTWDRVLCWAPRMEPASPSAWSLPLSLSLCLNEYINKIFKKYIKKKQESYQLDQFQ